MEQEKIVSEYQEVMSAIVDLLDILSNSERVTKMISDDLEEMKSEYGDKRRSEIVENAEDLSIEDLITPQEMVVTLSNSGYIKAQVLDDYRAQRRGGRGKQAMTTKDDDFIEQKEQTKNKMLCDVRNTFEKFNLISGLHSFMSDENKIYKNVLPPISILNEKDKLLLIDELNKLNFTLGSLKAA